MFINEVKLHSALRLYPISTCDSFSYLHFGYSVELQWNIAWPRQIYISAYKFLCCALCRENCLKSWSYWDLWSVKGCILNEFICVSISSTCRRTNCGSFSFPKHSLVVVMFLVKANSFFSSLTCGGKWRFVTSKWAERGKRIRPGKGGWEARGEWRNLHMRSFVICVWNEMKSMGIRWERSMESMGKKRNACRDLLKCILKGKCEKMDWIDLAQDRDCSQHHNE